MSADSLQPDPTPEDLRDDGAVEQWMRDTSPPEPSPAAWDAVLRRIQAAVPVPTLPSTSSLPRRRAWPWLAAGGAAAAVLLVLLARTLLTPPAAESLSNPVLVEAPRPNDSARAEALTREQGAAFGHLAVSQAEKAALATAVSNTAPLFGQLVMQSAESEADAMTLPDLPLLSHDQVTLHDRPHPDIRLELWGTPMIVDPQLMKDR
jgi:hypothetical protein